MEQGETKRKKHTGLKIFLAFLFLLLAVTAGVVIRFYPIYKEAGYMADHFGFRKLDYILEVRIDRSKLNKRQNLLIDTLAEVTGLTGGELCHLTVQGSVDGDIIFAAIYPEGQKKPLTEVYLSDDLDVVNGAMLYSAMREHICGQNKTLDYLFPVWENHRYMSLEQAEDMFGVDLSDLRDYKLPVRDMKLSRLQCFGILVLMEREKMEQGRYFCLQTEGLEAMLQLKEPAEVSISMEDPEAVTDMLEDKLSRAGVRLSGEKLGMLKQLAVRAVIREDLSLTVPEDLISQKMVDVVKGIRVIIKGLFGK